LQIRYDPKGAALLKRIAHTTDFSTESMGAFIHALRLALATRSRLDILHVKTCGEDDSWEAFPHVRPTLIRWGLLDPQAAPADIEANLGVHVSKIEINHDDAQGGISTFLLSHRPDLVVVATHGRMGLHRWLHGSVSEDLLRRTHVPTLLMRPDNRGFVDLESGTLRLRRILVPVAPSPSPERTLHILDSLLSPLGITSDSCELMNVGYTLPVLLDSTGKARAVEQFEGEIVETIFKVAEQRNVDLIAMATAGHHGFLDAFRGSTTKRVLALAPCPVLAMALTAS
jgi:nucleotide-binding universal stress UspA family protein